MVADPIRTLVVDDEPDIRRLYTMIVGLSADFSVVGTADNGELAIQAAEVYKPDLILLDVMMPVLDGIDALPRIRTAAPDAKVVILTALEVRLVNEKRIEGAHADAVLLKTILPNELLDELRKVMRS